MSKPRFSIRFPDTEKPYIYYDITISAGKRIRGKTNTYLLPGTIWDEEERTVTGDNTAVSEITGELGDFEDFVKKTIKEIKDHTNVKHELKAKIEEYFGRIDLDDEKRIPIFKEYIDQYIEEKENEMGDDAVKTETIQEYRNFKKIILEYEKGRTALSFERINKIFYKKYVNFLEKNKEFSPNTIGKHIKTLKAIMRASWIANFHDCRWYESFKVIKVKSKNVAYLDKNQLKELAKLDLTGRDAAARDYWLLMSYSGMRVGEIMKLDNSAITEEDGERIISYQASKTKDDDFRAFIITPEMEAIFDKYNGGFPVPKVTANYINIVIKNFTGNPEIHNHSARRSYCTNAFLQMDPVIPVTEIMFQSGHKKESTFYTYIKATNAKIAAAIAKRRRKANEAKR